MIFCTCTGQYHGRKATGQWLRGHPSRSGNQIPPLPTAHFPTPPSRTPPGGGDGGCRTPRLPPGDRSPL